MKRCTSLGNTVFPVDLEVKIKIVVVHKVLNKIILKQEPLPELKGV